MREDEPRMDQSIDTETLASLDGTVAMTVLRHAALQRHVRMNAQPVPVGVTRENDRRPPWPVEATAVSVEAGARPGRDHCRHCSVGAG